MPNSALTDPLNRVIVLHDHTWFGHMLKGHPEMKGLRGESERAITAPDSICYSNSSVNCRLYFAANPAGPLPYIAVVADLRLGLVLTAYQAKRIKGAIEW